MSSVYDGFDSFPSGATIPDDGETITALAVNTPLEAALDRGVWAKNRMLAVARFGVSKVNPRASTSIRDGRPAFSKKRLTWHLGVADNNAQVTDTFLAAYRFVGAVDPSAGRHIAIINDPANARYGNGLAIPQIAVTGCTSFTDSTGAWTSSGSGPALLPTNTWSGLLHEPVSDKWLAWGSNKLANSPTSGSLTWASRTIAGSSQTLYPCHNGAGQLVISHTALGIATSSNGGDTWTVQSPGFTGVAISGLAWDEFRLRFVALVTTATGTDVWESLDAGVSWTRTKVDAFAGLGVISELTPVGHVLLGVTLDSAVTRKAIVYSVDGGLSWGFSGQVFGNPTTAVFLATNGGDAVAVNLGASNNEVAWAVAAQAVTR
jgi:hypothetical protein